MNQEQDMPFGGPSKKYPYKCSSCGLENDVEDIVIDAFIASMEYQQTFGFLSRVFTLFCGAMV